ncbi:hypothetical protein CR513_40927, partial [Mucuna pruriens]
MSKPSNCVQRPCNNIVVQRQQKKDTMIMCLDHKKLTRELSNLSNEAYHGEFASSVPFVWESQPGTPKVRFKENSLPPLTPPPSYFPNATKKPTTKAKSKNSSPKTSFLQTLFPKRDTKKGTVLPPQTGSSNIWSYSSSSPSSSSSSSLSFSSPRPTSYSVPSSPMVHSKKGEEDEDLYEVTSSNLCFGNAGSRGCYSSMIKKNCISIGIDGLPKYEDNAKT